MESVSLVKDAWLGDMLGKPAYHVRFGAGECGPGRLAQALGALNAAPEVFLDAVVDAGQAAKARLCEDAGFRLVEASVRLEGAPHPAGARDAQSGAQLRPAQAGDRAQVEAIAGHCFRGSRFHADPLIPRELADALKARWAGNFFTGQRGDAMTVAQAEGRVAGFLLALHRPDVMVIDLVAVDPEFRGRGLGAALVRAAHAQSGLPGLAVGTQAANAPALALYQSLGMRVRSLAFVLHHHGACHADRRP